MNVEFIREINGSYMVLSDLLKHRTYEDRMIEENNIPGILKWVGYESDAGFVQRYDIQKKRTLKSVFLREGISRKTILAIMNGILDEVEIIGEYLLKPSGIVLMPETIFLEEEESGFKVYLTYVPGASFDFNEGLIKVAEYMIENLDHSDADATAACYYLYDKLNEGELSLKEIVESLCNQNFFDEKLVEDTVKEDLSLNMIISNEIDDENNPPYFNYNYYEEDLFNVDEKEYKPTKKKKGGFSAFIKNVFKKKKESFYEDSYTFEDFIMEPDYDDEEEYSQTTVLNDVDSLIGRRLRYEGKEQLSDIVISKTPFIIGTLSSNDHVIRSSVISRVHARINMSEGNYYIEDLESANGTYVNGQLLSLGNQIILNKGDIITFADKPYRFM